MRSARNFQTSGVLSMSGSKRSATFESRYMNFVGGCVFVALFGSGDRLLFWGGLVLLVLAALLVFFWLVGLIR